MSDDEWAFVHPSLMLVTAAAPQRRHDGREVFHARRWIVRAGAPWRLLPGDLPPKPGGSQQPRRWIVAGCLEVIVHDLRVILRCSGRRAAACGSGAPARRRREVPIGSRRPCRPPFNGAAAR